jgi:hypothetical protein
MGNELGSRTPGKSSVAQFPFIGFQKQFLLRYIQLMPLSQRFDYGLKLPFIR